MSDLPDPDELLAHTAHRPWPLPEGPWLMSQSWHDLLFAHWPLDPDALLGPFRVSMPALDQFPIKTWARLVSRRARTMSMDAMAYGAAAGHEALRHAIADYLRTARAVSGDASDVLVVVKRDALDFSPMAFPPLLPVPPVLPFEPPRRSRPNRPGRRVE